MDQKQSKPVKPEGGQTDQVKEFSGEGTIKVGLAKGQKRLKEKEKRSGEQGRYVLN